MHKALRIGAMALAVFAGMPAHAYAADGESIVPSWLPFAGGFVSLLVALFLLVVVLRLRRFALGSAISSSALYVIVAVPCLAASALVYWFSNFLPTFTVDHAILASNLLVTAAMALLALYFVTVRRRLAQFVRDLMGSGTDSDDAEGVTHA